MLERGIVSMRADKLDSLLRKGRSQLLFHLSLRWPASLVGGKTQISAGNKQHFVGCRFCT
jgi:hypothetical protein